MLVTIKKEERWKLNYILLLNEMKFGIWQISLMETILVQFIQQLCWQSFLWYFRLLCCVDSFIDANELNLPYNDYLPYILLESF